MRRVLSIVLALATAGSARAAAPETYAAWKAGHPNAAAQIADLKAKTAALIAAAGPAPKSDGVGKYAEEAMRSKALTPAQKAEAGKLFDEGFRHWQSRDFVGAKKILAQGLAIDPASGSNFYMGDILDREGDKAAAAVAMDKARTLAQGTVEGEKAALALPGLPLPVKEGPDVDKPPIIWRVPGAIDTVWDLPEAPEMVVVPAGEYTMGSPASEPGREDTEGPRHRVRIGYPLAVSKYPVTVAEFDAFIKDANFEVGDRCETFRKGKFDFIIGSDVNNPGFPQTGDSPAVCLNWHDANAYVDWLSKKTGQKYRLLTEAEYEYVTRAGTTTTYWWGNDPAKACEYVNGADLDAKAEPQLSYWAVNDCHDGAVYTSPAGSFKPNPFGLYGVSGNSLSWVQDCWSDSYHGARVDGSAVVDPYCYKVTIRGGAWSDKPSALRAALRGWNIHNIRFSMNGFRIARGL